MSSYSNLKFEIKLFLFIIFLKAYILSNHINKNVDFKKKKLNCTMFKQICWS
jgi:hypothetical protein